MASGRALSCEFRARYLIDRAFSSVNPGGAGKYVAPMYTRVFRFAPSPNGYLHLGHAYSALLNDDMARRAAAGCCCASRISMPRAAGPEYEAAIYEDLRWLGISWQQPVRRQSEHFDDYEPALAKLEAQGLLYPSFESRSEIAALVAERDRADVGRAIRTACRSIPGGARKMPKAERDAPPRQRRAVRAAARHGCGRGARRRR